MQSPKKRCGSLDSYRLPHLGPRQAVPGSRVVVDEAAESDAVRVPGPWRAQRLEHGAAERGEGHEVER
jgi:hypothetical protein